jgi:hypothetical protein
MHIAQIIYPVADVRLPREYQRRARTSLTGARPERDGWAQVWGHPAGAAGEGPLAAAPAARRKVTCADPLHGRAGTVAYGPNVNAAAVVLLDSRGNVPAEWTAMLMSALLGAPVSARFVARAYERARAAARSGRVRRGDEGRAARRVGAVRG